MRKHPRPVQSIVNLAHGVYCNADPVPMPAFTSADSCTDKSVRVDFNADDHTYLLRKDGTYRIPILSVTAACAAAEPPFNEQKALACVMRTPRKPRYAGLSRDDILALWNDTKTTAAQLGTEAHFQIECMLRGLPYADIPEVSNALYCLEVVCAVLHIDFAPSDIDVLEVEGLLTGMDNEIAGSPDLLLRMLPSNKIVVVDWKRSTAQLQNQAREFMAVPLQDSYYSKYHAQLSFYSQLLEDAGFEVSACFLCNVHPDCTDTRVVRVPRRPILARRIACALSRKVAALHLDESVPKCALSGRAVRQTCTTALGQIDIRVAKALAVDIDKVQESHPDWARAMAQPFTRCTKEGCCDLVETRYIADMSECMNSVAAVVDADSKPWVD